MSAKIIAIANQKGGCAKTTTAVALASGLKFHGKKALLVDMDPQCNATDTYKAKVHDTYTLHDMLIEGVSAKECIQHTEVGDIIACDKLLKDASTKLPDGPKRFTAFKRGIKEVRDLYDYIIIDTPPQLGILLYNGLIAADELIIPLLPARYAISGMSDLYSTINEIVDVAGKDDFKIRGVLFVRANANQTLTKDVGELLPTLCSKLHTKCFETTIRESVVVGKAQARIQTLYDYEAETSPKKPLAVVDDYRNFVAEFLKGEQ